jgi:general secretion pathway protein K
MARQRGSVLIIAILIVAMVSGFAIKASRDYQLSMARAEARWHGAQARAYLSGAESLAIYFLELDQNQEVDTLLEPWAQEMPPFPVEGGMILAKIEDATAKLNLNKVVEGGLNQNNSNSPNAPERFKPSQKRFLRLLQSFPERYPVSQEQAISILEAVIDWTDPDSNIEGYNGAERDYYQSLEPSYAPPNAVEFTSLEELRLVRHMTGELMTLLRPYITVLPRDATLNVNTLHPHMLRVFNAKNSLAPLSAEQAGQLQQEAGAEYGPENKFADNPAWGTLLTEQDAIDTTNIATNSRYFRVTTRVHLGEQRRSMQSLLYRDDKQIKVIARRDVYDYILDLEQATTPTTSGQTTDNE